MWAHGVVVAPPAFDDDLSFLQGVKDLAVEQFIAKLRVEARAIAVFPWAAWHDVGYSSVKAALRAEGERRKS